MELPGLQFPLDPIERIAFGDSDRDAIALGPGFANLDDHEFEGSVVVGTAGASVADEADSVGLEKRGREISSVAESAGGVGDEPLSAAVIHGRASNAQKRKEIADDGQADSTQSTVHVNPEALGWIRRVRVGGNAVERTLCANRVGALEQTIRSYAEIRGDHVVEPSLGLTVDSLEEAYDFYNLYSWEQGFGIRYGKSRLNPERTKTMQEIVCGCSGKPVKENSRSCRCECPAMIRLLRTKDNGWYITEQRVKHNHAMSATCAEKVFWPLHKHIDTYTKDLVRQLRENNINIGKVYNIIGSFYGAVGNVPFTKRTLKSLCGQISKDQADDDLRKTIEVFAEIASTDREFSYRVLADAESRIRNLMWTNGSSINQYRFFGDAVMFDTTYRTNLYDMPFGLFVGVNNHFQSIILAV
uniref:Uncharacterized protein n=1 Tax=Avena sativa TaxID=4498 RepID=A0ACD6A8I6_AVESA